MLLLLLLLLLIQRRATKFILKSDDEYLVRLRKLRLLSLENRRLVADVIFFYEVVNNHVRLVGQRFPRCEQVMLLLVGHVDSRNK